MANYAKVALTGRLTKDPKKNSYNNMTVISFTVAVFTTKKKDEKYVTDYYQVSFWGKGAESVFPKLEKGTMVQVYGDQYQEEYTDSNNTKRLGVAVRANDVIKLADPKGESAPKKVEVEEDPF